MFLIKYIIIYNSKNCNLNLISNPQKYVFTPKIPFSFSISLLQVQQAPP